MLTSLYHARLDCPISMMCSHHRGAEVARAQHFRHDERWMSHELDMALGAGFRHPSDRASV